MRVVFLGTGTSPRLERANAAIAVQLSSVVDGRDQGAPPTVILDTAGGNEVIRQLQAAGIALATIQHIFISHQHFDHSGGLSILLAKVAGQHGNPITVYAPSGIIPGLRSVVETQIPGALSTRLAGRLHWHPLQPGESAALEIGEGEPVRLTAVAAVHPVPTVGCVLSHNGKRVGYTGDTAFFDGLAAAYAGVDLLIHEATKLDDPAADALYRIAHSTAGDAGRVAAAAGVGRLILTHLGPKPHDAPQAALAEACAFFSGPVQVAEDLLTVDLN